METSYKKIEELQKRLLELFGINVEIELLTQAMSHTSYINEMNEDRSQSYEKLEFLGDAILQFSITKFIYINYPDLDEGGLTRLRANIVQSASLSQFSREIGLEKAVLLGQGEMKNGGNTRRSLLEDIFESLIGAIYLSSGLDDVQVFLEKTVIKDVETGELKENKDYKTTLQELLQKDGTIKIEYIPVEHNEEKNEWIADLLVNGQLLSSGSGHNRKIAEQDAAKKALKKVQSSEES